MNTASNSSSLAESESNHSQLPIHSEESVTKLVREVRRWICDVCGDAFDSFEEACEHEESCRNCEKLDQQESHPNTSFRQTSSFCSVQEKTLSKPPKKADWVKKSLISHKRRNATACFDKHANLCEYLPTQSSEEKVDTNPSLVNTSFVKSRKLSPGSSSDVASSTRSSTVLSKAMNSVPCVIRTNFFEPSSSSSDLSVSNILSGLSKQELLQIQKEQETATFRAQRLAKEKRIRDIKAKKHAARQLCSVKSLNNLVSSTSLKVPERNVNWITPKFPVPSHMINALKEYTGNPTSICPVKSTSLWLNPSSLMITRRDALQSTLVPNGYSSVSRMPHLQGSSVSDAVPSFDMYTEEPSYLPAHFSNLLQHILTNSLLPPSSRPKGKASSQDLWADVHTYATTSNSLKETRSQLSTFVREWMVKRHQAHSRCRERQERYLQPQARRPSMKKRKHEDDDEWIDKHDDEQSNGMSAVCLLTGPTGSHKTSLVYSVVAECDCRVLEINTTSKRGATDLKRLAEEATRSHNSIDLLQKSSKNVSQKSAVVHPQVTTFTDRRQQVEDMNSKDTGLIYELPDDDDEDTERLLSPGSALTVILVDEVDLIYEDDSGFWSSLIEIAHYSKSPIILTANTVPMGIRKYGSYKAVEVSRPSTDDCVAWIRRVIELEGLNFRIAEVHTQNFLTLLAVAANHDLRRLAHELQLLSHSPPMNIVTTLATPIDATTNDTSPSFPKICRIDPISVRSDSCTLITIYGCGFMRLAASFHAANGGGFPVCVLIGGRMCPDARIINDSVILAVKAPCLRSADVLHPASRRFVCRRIWSHEYKDVHISSLQRLGMFSTTRGTQNQNHLDPSPKLGVISRVPLHNVICHISTMHTTDSEDESVLDEELELETPRQQTVFASSKIPPVDEELVHTLLVNGMSNLTRRGEDFESPLSMDVDNSSSYNIVESLARNAGLASDAALIQELGNAGTPFLSGPCRGFGFDLTAISSISCETSKPPSAECLFECKWNHECYFYGSSNSYMTRPCALERHWHHSIESSRGQAPWIEDSTRRLDLNTDSQANEPLQSGECCYDEDTLLSNHSPSCISFWALLMMHENRPLSGISAFITEYRLTQSTRERIHDQLSVINELFNDMYQINLFARGTDVRPMDSTVRRLMFSNDLVEQALVLDYLPMLRVMAATDFQFLASKDPSSFSLSLNSAIGKRKTRNSSRSFEKRHFLGELVSATYYDEQRVQSLVKRLSMWALHKCNIQ